MARAMLATVVSADDDTAIVRPDNAGASTNVGPIHYFYAKPTPGQQVVCFWVPDSQKWVAWTGRAAATADMTIVWPSNSTFVPMYMRRSSGVWTAPAAVPDVPSGSPFPSSELAVAPSGLNEGLAALAEPSLVWSPQIDTNWDITGDTGRIFRMSDGGVVAVYFLDHGAPFANGIQVVAHRRAPDGTWDAPVEIYTGPNAQTNMSVACRDGDTIYGLAWIGFGDGYGGDMLPFRVDYNGGAGLTVTTGPILPELFAGATNDQPLGAYFDPASGHVHYLYWDYNGGSTGFLRLAAVDPSTLTAIHYMDLGSTYLSSGDTALAQITGDGTKLYVAAALVGTFSPRSLAGHIEVTRITANPTTYTAVGEVVPDAPDYFNDLGAVWDGTRLVLFHARRNLNGIWTLNRLGDASYDPAWTQITTDSSQGRLGVSLGGKTRMMWRQLSLRETLF